MTPLKQFCSGCSIQVRGCVPIGNVYSLPKLNHQNPSLISQVIISYLYCSKACDTDTSPDAEQEIVFSRFYLYFSKEIKCCAWLCKMSVKTKCLQFHLIDINIKNI